MILAAHQPNCIPWLPYFDKMNKADVFVLMVNVQFEKNGWQNRCRVFDKWWTIPVKKGMEDINKKEYMNGENLVDVNIQWIKAIAMTIGIDTNKITVDFESEKKGTGRIIELCEAYKCNEYLTNPDAMNKYLDESEMNRAGIKVVHHKFPHKVHVFEAFDRWGIEGTRKILKKERARCGI